VEEDCVADYREAEARAAHVLRAVGVEPEEALEYPVELPARDPDPVVVVVEAVFTLRHYAACADARAVTGIFQSVLHQIAEYGIDQLTVGADADRRQLIVKRNPMTLKRLRHLVRDFQQHRPDIDRSDLELVRHLLQLGDQGDVLDHIGEAQRLQIGALDEEPALVLTEFRVVDHRLQIGLDARHRRLQLVGDVARHLVLQPAGLAVGALGLLALVAVGQIDQSHQRQHQQEEYAEYQHPVRPEELAEIDLEELRHADYPVVVGLGEIEIFPVGGVGLPDGSARPVLQAVPDLGTPEMILHHRHGLRRVQQHQPVPIHHRNPQVFGKIAHHLGDRVGLRHHIGIAFQAGLDDRAAVAVLAHQTEVDGNQREAHEHRRDGEYKLIPVSHSASRDNNRSPSCCG